jgi:16S rRNA (guanine(966)-N(2))-methyltransferase RsmD
MIQAPAGLPVRPTTDYAKSGLFNVLSNEIEFEGLRVLDLFAGIGGISFEFISRGAGHVTAVDQNFKTVQFIKSTAERLQVKNLDVIRMDVFKYLKRCSEKFDLIFADPPFDMEETDQLIPLITELKLVKDGGLLVVEHSSSRSLVTPEIISSVRTYGNCSFSFVKF